MYANCFFTACVCWEECVTCAPTATFIKMPVKGFTFCLVHGTSLIQKIGNVQVQHDKKKNPPQL